MKTQCEIIRDLLPLYADDVCSGSSRALIEEHLRECPDCRRLLSELGETELENDLRREKDTVIRYAVRQFRRRSAAAGSLTSVVLLIPILVCLAVNLVRGPSLDWVSVVLASLAVAASLVVVPLVVPEDKAFWTFCAFCGSLLLLLGVVCLYSHGTWFWVASSAVLFGLSVVFLPFLVRARPVKKLLGDSNRLFVILGLDVVLFINMLNMIRWHSRTTPNSILFTLFAVAGAGVVILEVLRHRTAGK